APEILMIYLARESRISSAVLVQAKGRGLAFQFSIQARMPASRARTLLCTPRRISLPVRYPGHRSTWLIQDDPVGGKGSRNPGVAGQPGPDGGGLAGGEVVAGQVHLQPGGHGRVDLGQESVELRGPVVAVQGADDGAVGDVERGEQAGGPVPDVVAAA